MKILLVSGHGAGDSGACAKISGKTYKEATETVTMVKKIKSAFANYNVTVDLYPTDRNMYEDLKAGCCKVNLDKYDYMLEIHFNACVNDLKGNGKTTGTEIFIPTTAKATVEDNIIANIATLGLKNRGVKKYNYTCIYRATQHGCKASLLEICFIDDKDDMDIYLKNKYAIAKKIVSAFVKQYKLSKKATASSTKTLKVGAKCKIKSGSKDLNTNKKYSDFVYKTTYNVQKIASDYVIFGNGTKATGKVAKSNIILQ